jgi:twitching motility protein PilJ
MMSDRSMSERYLPWLGGGLIVLLALAIAGQVVAGRTAGEAVAQLQGNRDQAVLAQRLAAVAGAARRHERSAFERLVGLQGELTGVVPAGDTGAAAIEREKVMKHASALAATRPALVQVEEAAARVDELVGQLLGHMADLMGMLPAAMRAEVAPHLDRFDLAAKGLQQDMTALAGGFGTLGLVTDRLVSGEDFMRQLIRGLAGEDSALGVPPVSGPGVEQQLKRVTDLFSALSAEVRTAASGADQLGQLQSTANLLESSAMRWSSALPAQPVADRSGVLGALVLPVLLGLTLVVAIGMLMLYRGAAGSQRSARAEAAQNERNQQAILRLLDELGSLADGDLTVEATVTEDITGAVADSINFAVEALRDLVATIEDSAIQIDAAARQTKASASHLATVSTKQSRHVTSATEAIANIATQIEEVSGNAERSADVARHSVDVAHKGGLAVRRTIDGMSTIRDTIQETSKRIKRLGESSQEIGNIVELINDIADQTNILALNASIQASMAGEAGRGFAVVADEVQRLAEKSANATKQIEVLVRTIQADTNEAVVSMEQSTTEVVGGATLAENAGAALDEIEKVSNQIASLVQNISNTARQQATAAAGVTRSMAVLQESSSQTAASTGATSTAIGKLATLAGGLRQSVAGFTLPDRGRAGEPLARQRSAASASVSAPEQVGALAQAAESPPEGGDSAEIMTATVPEGDSSLAVDLEVGDPAPRVSAGAA